MFAKGPLVKQAKADNMWRGMRQKDNSRVIGV